MSDTDWQTEILGDRAAMIDALRGLVPDPQLGDAASHAMARLAADRNGVRLLIRAERYEELEQAAEQLADAHALIRALYLEDIRSDAQNELLASIVTDVDGEL